MLRMLTDRQNLRMAVSLTRPRSLDKQVFKWTFDRLQTLGDDLPIHNRSPVRGRSEFNSSSGIVSRRVVACGRDAVTALPAATAMLARSCLTIFDLLVGNPPKTFELRLSSVASWTIAMAAIFKSNVAM